MLTNHDVPFADEAVRQLGVGYAGQPRAAIAPVGDGSVQRSLDAQYLLLVTMVDQRRRTSRSDLRGLLSEQIADAWACVDALSAACEGCQTRVRPALLADLADLLSRSNAGRHAIGEAATIAALARWLNGEGDLLAANAAAAAAAGADAVAAVLTEVRWRNRTMIGRFEDWVRAVLRSGAA